MRMTTRLEDQLTYRYIQTKQQLKDAVGVIRKYLQQRTGDNQKPMIAVDTETYRPQDLLPMNGRKKKNIIPRAVWNGSEWEGRVRTIQLGLDPTNPEWRIRDIQFIIDVKKLGEKLVAAALKPLLDKPSKTVWLCQGGKYDIPFAQEFFNITPYHVVDTMLTSQVYWSGDRLSHDLGNQYENFFRKFGLTQLFEKLTGGKTYEEYRDFKKKMQKAGWAEVLTKRQLEYARDDVRILFYLRNAQTEAIERWEEKYERNFPACKGIRRTLKLEYAVLPIFAKMERYGIKIDRKYLTQYVIPLMDRKVEEAKRVCAQFKFLRKERVKGQNSLLFILRDREFDPDAPKFTKQLLTRLYPDLEKLSVKKSSKGRDVCVTVSWSNGPDRRELLPTVRATLRPEAGWRFSDDRVINMRSSKVLKERLSAALGEEVTSTREKYLKSLIDPHDPGNKKYDIIYAVLDYVKAANYASKYGRGLLEQTRANDYAYPSWNQLGSEHSEIVSGRSSVNGPPIHQMSSRAQLYAWRGKKGIASKKLIRRCFIAEDGCVFIVADYSGIEPRLTAEITADKLLRRIFLKGGDQHAETAKFVLDLDELPKKGDDDRDLLGKEINLGMTYGMALKGLHAHLVFKLFGKRIPPTLEEVKEIWTKYWELYSGVRKYIDRVEAKVTKRLRKLGSLAPFKGRKEFGVAHTMRGRHRRFCISPEQETMSDEKLDADYDPTGSGWYFNQFKRRLGGVRLKAFNHEIQGTAADMLKLAEVYVDREIEKRGWDPSLNHIKIVMHDELVVQAEAQHADAMQKLVEVCMRRAAAQFLKVIPCEIHIGQGINWYEAGKQAEENSKHREEVRREKRKRNRAA